MKKIFGEVFGRFLALRACSLPAAALLLVSITLLQNTAGAANRDVCPSCTYTTISAALTAAVSNDVIRIAGGTYNSVESIQGTRNLSIYGGYSNDFSTRDPAGNPSILAPITISFHTGNIVLDGLTLHAGSGYTGLYAYSSTSNVTVNNCVVEGIFFFEIGTAIITNNTVTYDGADYGVVNIPSGWTPHVQVTITNNLISGGSCSSCAGIYINYLNSTDSIEGNTISDSYQGMHLHFANSAATTSIANNTVAENANDGVYSTGGSPQIKHNLFRDNGGAGIDILSSSAAVFLNNVFARNYRGLYLQGNNGTPDIRNNIFYQSTSHGLDISGTGGWGATSTNPIAVNYNCFFGSGSNAYINTNLPVQGMSNEEPGSYGDINAGSSDTGNFIQDPHFVDAANNDFRLASNSFLIDEGDPASDFADEPAPNGGRINVGLYGDTAADVTSVGAPTISNLSAGKSGSDILVTFDTNTASSVVWVTLDYWDGGAWVQVNPAYVTGSGYTVGYKAGRVTAGAGRALSIANVSTSLGLTSLVNSKIRVTLEHAADSVQAESGTFSGIFTPPTVALTAPAVSGVLTSTTPNFTATASDTDGIANVKFYYKNSADSSFTLISTDSSAPYQAVWGGITLTPGESYDFQVVASDALDNTASDSNYGVSYCTYAFVSGSKNVTRIGTAWDAALTVSPSSCSWSAVSNTSWITTSSAGIGSASVYFSVGTNSSSSARTGTITAAGQTLTVNQAGGSCNFSLGAGSASLSSAATSGSVTLGTGFTDCGWTATSNSSWLVPTVTSGTGATTLGYIVQANTTENDRVGTLTVGGQTFTVTQSTASCSFTLSAQAVTFPSDGGTADVAVTANRNNCHWSASNDSLWFSLSANSGVGSQTLHISADSNSSSTPRSGNIQIQGQTISVQQSSPTSTLLTIHKQGSNLGEVTVGDASCGSNCSEIAVPVEPGSTVALTAHAASGVHFVRWNGGNCGTAANCTVPISEALTVNAVFARSSEMLLLVGTSGPGTGAVALSSRGRSCGSGCALFTSSRAKPKKVTLTARPAKNSTFVGWSGACKGQDKSCELSLSSNLSSAARFVVKKRIN